jgi:hypothetical protein
MFLRRCVRRKNGKEHTYWALVESYRTGRGSRQRLVAYLGELRRSEQHLSDKGWQEVQAGVEVKLVPGADGNAMFVLARSADRRKKEAATRTRQGEAESLLET